MGKKRREEKKREEKRREEMLICLFVCYLETKMNYNALNKSSLNKLKKLQIF